MRFLILSIVSLSLVPTAQAYDRQKLLSSFFSTVMVRGYKADGGMAYGSGVVVEKDKVLTNCHIFRETRKPWISRGEDSFVIETVQADRWHDLCLVSASNLPAPAAVLGSSDTLQRGQPIAAIGFSNGVPAPLTSLGTIKSLYPMDDGNVIRSTARFALGASGSGLFDEEGRLIGINTFKTPGRVAYFYALPVTWLQKLKTQPVETKFPITGQAFWEADEQKQPYFMQAALPQLHENWEKLAEVAKRWTEAQPANTEAWYELGVAHENLGDQGNAERAFRKSVELDSHNTDSLFRIGIIASKKGDRNEVHAINLALSDIDQELAQEFSVAAGCNGPC